MPPGYSAGASTFGVLVEGPPSSAPIASGGPPLMVQHPPLYDHAPVYDLRYQEREVGTTTGTMYLSDGSVEGDYLYVW